MFTNCLYFLSNALSRDLSNEWDRAFAPLGLTAAQAYMLVLIIRQGPLPQKKIAEEMLLEVSTVTRSLAGLIRRKLVSTKPSSQDARSRLAQATKKGRALEDQIVQTSRALNARLKTRFGEHQLESLRTQIEKTLLSEIEKRAAS